MSLYVTNILIMMNIYEIIFIICNRLPPRIKHIDCKVRRCLVVLGLYYFNEVCEAVVVGEYGTIPLPILSFYGQFMYDNIYK